MTKAQRTRSLATHRTHYVKRIVKAWHSATTSDLEAGLAWYDRARAHAEVIHPNVLIGAGVIAALSPRCEWSLNKRWAQTICDAAIAGSSCPSGVHTFAMRSKAWKIARLANPTVEQIVTILNGPKITRFFRNIIGDTSAVTIDVWAQRIATGKDSSTPPKGAMYLTLERAYQLAAEQIGVPARDVQAATWVNIRGAAESLYGDSTSQLGLYFEESDDNLDATFAPLTF